MAGRAFQTDDFRAKCYTEGSDGGTVSQFGLDELPQDDAIMVLVDCLRENAQDTYLALRRRGYVICRKP